MRAVMTDKEGQSDVLNSSFEFFIYSLFIGDIGTAYSSVVWNRRKLATTLTTAKMAR